MTSYFSTQITDLQGVYTAKDYWATFAVIMFLSFIALFFLSRFLVRVTESLEARVNRTSAWCKRAFQKSIPPKRKSKEDI
jgi:hypothetical protein